MRFARWGFLGLVGDTNGLENASSFDGWRWARPGIIYVPKGWLIHIIEELTVKF